MKTKDFRQGIFKRILTGMLVSAMVVSMIAVPRQVQADVYTSEDSLEECIIDETEMIEEEELPTEIDLPEEELPEVEMDETVWMEDSAEIQAETTSSDVIETEQESVSEEEPTYKVREGLQKTENGTRYYVNGKPVKSTWVTFKKGKRYFDSKGYMVIGWKKIDGYRYYFNKYGYRKHSTFFKIEGNTYYFTKSGKAKTGWFKLDGAKYCFDSQGRMRVGWYTEDGDTYYFKKNGKMVVGWGTKDGNTYYFTKAGKLVKGKCLQIANDLCTFDKDGILIRKINLKKPMVALTWDDGPSNYTKDILKALKDNNAVGTFFVVGERLNYYKSTLKAEYDQGNEIGNHTYHHKILSSVGASTIQKEIADTNRLIENLVGVRPVVMRPPGGGMNSTVRSYVGMPMILWSIDTLDWKTRNSSSTISAVLNHVKDGDIVLMHDLYQATASASKVIIPRLAARGYQMVTVSELALCRNVKLSNGVAYYSMRP